MGNAPSGEGGGAVRPEGERAGSRNFRKAPAPQGKEGSRTPALPLGGGLRRRPAPPEGLLPSGKVPSQPGRDGPQPLHVHPHRGIREGQDRRPRRMAETQEKPRPLREEGPPPGVLRQDRRLPASQGLLQSEGQQRPGEEELPSPLRGLSAAGWKRRKARPILRPQPFRQRRPGIPVQRAVPEDCPEPSCHAASPFPPVFGVFCPRFSLFSPLYGRGQGL